MRVSDLVEGGAYATCDGEYIEPSGDPTRKWTTRRETREDGSQQTVLVPYDSPDPWSRGCSTGSRGALVGIRVRQFEVDASGNPIEGTGEVMLVNPRDIKGTWLEYLALHAETVKIRARTREIEQERRAFREALLEPLSEAGLSLGSVIRVLPDQEAQAIYGRSRVSWIISQVSADSRQYDYERTVTWRDQTYVISLAVEKPAMVLERLGVSL